MAYSKRSLLESDKDSLVQIVIDLQLKQKKKNAELLHTRTKLNAARSKMLRLEETVRFQRSRILELYPSALTSNVDGIEGIKSFASENAGS